jgi:hypothetical protein
MSRRPQRFTQADVTRAIRGAQAAGLTIARVEIDVEGKIVIVLRDVDVIEHIASSGPDGDEVWTGEDDQLQGR